MEKVRAALHTPCALEWPVNSAGQGNQKRGQLLFGSSCVHFRTPTCRAERE